MRRLVPDELWALAEPLIPPQQMRPQGRGTRERDARCVFAAVVFVLTTGCAWRHLPPVFGVSKATARRRFTAWTQAGVWRRLHRRVLDELGSQGEIDWSRAVLDSAAVRAKKGGGLTGPNPVDRGKTGSKIHAVAERHGLPLAVEVSAANTNDHKALKPLVKAIPPVRSRRGPRRRRPVRLHAGKAYDVAELRVWLRRRGITSRIARKGIESSEKLGRHRWIIERSVAWLLGYHRLAIRYERHAHQSR